MAGLIRFAHRGAPSGTARENTLAAFSDALRNGAEGLESDVCLTADGVPVLAHGRGIIDKQPVSRLTRAQLPDHMPALADVWEQCGNEFELALDMTDPRAAAAVVDLARRHGAFDRLWLTYWRLPQMVEWRRRWPDVKLVYATMFGLPNALLRRTSLRVAGAGVDAVNLYHRLIVRGSAETAHDAGLKLFAWGLRRSEDIPRVVALGADAVFVDDIGS
jgi:glycerophosphoryl diester phosphodiesterase